MKKFLLQFLVIISIAVVTGCTDNACKTAICPTNQVCFNGDCYCQNGREGSDCSEFSAYRYQGNYDVYEVCYTGTSPAPFYSTFIELSGTPESVMINNFANSGTSIEAFISTSTSTRKGTHLTINVNNGVIEVNCEGDFNEATNQIILQGSIRQGFESRNCEITMIKR